MSKRPRVAFQGEPGAFSQEAVRQLFGEEAAILPCPRFIDVFTSLMSKTADAAVIPMENTLHGSVHENYDHLLDYDVRITGETSVRIVHNLIVLPGVRFAEVRRVFSHPVALNQCLDFFARNPQIEKAPFYDTAGSVKMLVEERPAGAAAIASSIAASLYGAHILRRSIEDDRRNFTRFFLLRRAGDRNRAGEAAGPWKTSIVFTTRNTPGALFRSISAFALRDLNLNKIESRPLRGKPWEYLFYVDFIGREDEPTVKNALNHLRELADFLRVLGSYPAAEAVSRRSSATAAPISRKRSS